MARTRPRPRPLRLERFEDRTTPSAAPYAFDPSFGTNGRVTTDLSTKFSGPGVIDTAVTPDGDVLELVGDVYGIQTLLRFNPDGTPDAAFGVNGAQVLDATLAGSIKDLEVLPDGRILIGGDDFVSADVPFDWHAVAVARLTPTGGLDTTFGDGGRTSLALHPYNVAWEQLLGLHVSADGSILAAGRLFTTSPPTISEDVSTLPGFYFDYGTADVVRLTPDGQQDLTYGGDGTATVTGDFQSFLSFTGTADGRAILTGARKNLVRDPDTGAITAVEIYAVADRLDATGRPDAEFGGDGHAEARIVNTAYPYHPDDPDPYGPYTAVQARSTIVVDTGWAVPQADGGVVVAADVKDFLVRDDYLSSIGPRVVRFGADGTPDAAFGTAGVLGEPTYTYAADGATTVVTPNDLVQLPDGSLTLLATITKGGGAEPIGGPYYFTTLLRYTADGQPQPIVGGSNRFYLSPAAPVPDALLGKKLRVDGDGRLLVAGLLEATTWSDPNTGRLGLGRLIDPNSPLFPADAPSGELALPNPPIFPGPWHPPTAYPDPFQFPPPIPEPNPEPNPGEGVDPPVVISDPGTSDPREVDLPPSPPPPPIDEGFLPTAAVVPNDLDGNGVADDVTTSGGSTVTVHLNGTTGGPTDVQFVAFEASFTGGVSVTTADVDGDGRADLIVSANDGGGGRVQVYSLVAGQVVKRLDFLGIDDDAFRGGATTSAADLDGDGVTDLIVAAGVGGGPRVAVFNGKTLLAPPLGAAPPKLVNDFFAFGGDDSGKLRNGVSVTPADVNADGRPDLIFGAGVGGAGRVYGVDGPQLLAGRFVPVVNFFVADDTASRDGVRLTAKDVNGDGTPDLMADAPTGPRVYDGRHLSGGLGQEPAVLDFAPVVVD